MPGEKMLGQFDNVFSPTAQRRNTQLAPGQPVVEVGPESPGVDEPAEPLVCGDDDAYIEGTGDMSADPLHRHLLNHP